MHNSNGQFSPVSNGVTKRIGCGILSTPPLSSTPVAHRTLVTPVRNPPYQRPPRYFLSNTNPTRSPVTPIKSSMPIQLSSGPLLASTRFNVNLGTYANSKSPGPSRQIVQYNKEAKEKRTPTHQAKYGSPGVFPIVHFFKKPIPIVSLKPNKVIIRLASPDGNFNGMSKYSRDLSNGALSERRSGFDGDAGQTSISTRNVIDALREISRKRIHTVPAFESNLEDSSKRQRVDCIDSSCDNNQNAKKESPVQESTSAKTTVSPIPANPQKVCVVDVIAASYTSSNFLKKQMEKGLKRKLESDESPKCKPKEIKVINVETQTKNAEVSTEACKKCNEKLAVMKQNEPEASGSNTKQEEKKTLAGSNPKMHVNIFDEKRLEIHRKNKLATLLSVFTGEPPNIIPYESCPKQQKEESKLVSILSPQNKPKHDKHVSFNLPSDKEEEEVTPEKSSAPVVNDGLEVKSSASSTSKAPCANSSKQVTNTLPSPVISSAVASGKFVVKSQDAAVINTSVSALPEPVTTTPPPNPSGSFKHDLPKTPIPTKSSGFPYDLKQNKVASLTATSQASGVASKALDAFHFSLKSPMLVGEEEGGQMVPSTPSSSGTAAPIPLPVAPSAASSTLITSPYSFSCTSVSPSAVLFPSRLKSTTTKTTSIFGEAPTSSAVSDATPATTAIFNFGTPRPTPKMTFVTSVAPLKLQGTTTLASNFGTTTTSPGLFGAASRASSPLFGVTTTTSTSIFGGVTTTTNPMCTTPASTPVFGAATNASTSVFGTAPNTSTPTFGTASNASTSVFGTAPNTSTPTFGTATNASTSVFGTAPNTSTPIFGTATNISTSAFDTVPNTSTPTFGTAPNTSTSTFGTATKTLTPTFCSTTDTLTSAFGTATNPLTSTFGSATSVSTSGFGTATNPSTSVFGTASSTSAPMFGTTVGTSTSIFGAATTYTSAPIFGATTSITTPIFGSTMSTSALKFGTTTTASIFVGGATSTSAPLFGTTTTSAFNGVPNFAPGFNSPGNFNAPNSFSTAVTTITAPFTSAATSIAPTFTNSSFGGTDAIFGAPTLAGGTPKPAFGFPSTPANAFRTNQAPTFGANQQVTSAPSNFTPNAPVTSAPSFGTNSPFATNPAVTSIPSSFGGPSFGSNLTTPSTSTAMFGSNSNRFNVSNVPPGDSFKFNSTFATPKKTSKSGSATSLLFNFCDQPRTTSIFDTPKTTSFGANPNQNVGFGGSSTLQQQTSPFGGQAPNAFPFQASQGNFGNKNAPFNAFGDGAVNFGEVQIVEECGSPNAPGFQFNNAPAFDANNTKNTSGPNLFNFGSINQAGSPSSSVFTFGSQGEAQKTNFNFSGGSFGGASSGFGSNLASSPAGTFSIGSGSNTTGRSRTQFKEYSDNDCSFEEIPFSPSEPDEYLEPDFISPQIICMTDKLQLLN